MLGLRDQSRALDPETRGCGMRYLSIDPGLRACGVAAWETCDDDPDAPHYVGLVSAALVRSGSKAHDQDAWRAMASAVAAWEMSVFAQGAQGIICEYPRTYGGRASKGDTNDLLQLASVVATLVTGGSFTQASLYRPQDWKGNVPKGVTKERVHQKLTSRERTCILWPAPSLCHNVSDAIGIGLFHFRR